MWAPTYITIPINRPRGQGMSRAMDLIGKSFLVVGRFCNGAVPVSCSCNAGRSLGQALHSFLELTRCRAPVHS